MFHVMEYNTHVNHTIIFKKDVFLINHRMDQQKSIRNNVNQLALFKYI